MRPTHIMETHMAETKTVWAPPEARRAEEWAPTLERPKVLDSSTITMATGCGTIHIIISVLGDGTPFEVFANLGKVGGCASAQLESVARVASILLRSGVSPEVISKQIVGIRCYKFAGVGPDQVLSCADAIGQALHSVVIGREVGRVNGEIGA